LEVKKIRRQTGRALIRAIAPFAFSSLLSGTVSLLSILLFSRLLSADIYGYYVTLLALVALCQTVAFSWLQSSIVRLHPEEADQSGRERLAHAVKFGFGLSAAAVSIVWAIGVVGLGQSSGTIVLGAAGLSLLLCRAWASLGQSWSRVMQRPWGFAGSQALESLGGLVLSLAGLAWRPGNPLIVLGAMTFASLLASVITPLPIADASAGFREARPRLRRMWKFGGPVAAVSIGYIVLAISDRLLISVLLGPAAAGAYSAASGVASRALGLLLPPIATATKPHVFTEFSRHGAPAAGQVLKRLSDWLTAVGLPITVILAAAPSALMSALLGRNLADTAATVLPWTAIGALLSSFLTLHFAVGLQIVHRTKWMLLAVAPAAACNVLLNMLLLPRFGILAAGWAMVASYAVALILTVRFGNRHFRVPFSLFDALRTAVACIPLAAFLQLELQLSLPCLVPMLGGAALSYAIPAFALDVAGSRTHLMRRFRRSSAFGP
jgi:O-antigen/teichoic acid export membrane protein